MTKRTRRNRIVEAQAEDIVEAPAPQPLQEVSVEEARSALAEWHRTHAEIYAEDTKLATFHGNAARLLDLPLMTPEAKEALENIEGLRQRAALSIEVITGLLDKIISQTSTMVTLRNILDENTPDVDEPTVADLGPEVQNAIALREKLRS